MAIAKQAFYEGAALYLVARAGGLTEIRYEAPFFILRSDVAVFLKYSTRIRSPWGFTFLPAEQSLLQTEARRRTVILGLICASDGVVALPYADYAVIAVPRAAVIHVSCHRQHGEHYEINGPDGTLGHKVAPSMWPNLLHLLKDEK